MVWFLVNSLFLPITKLCWSFRKCCCEKIHCQKRQTLSSVIRCEHFVNIVQSAKCMCCLFCQYSPLMTKSRWKVSELWDEFSFFHPKGRPLYYQYVPLLIAMKYHLIGIIPQSGTTFSVLQFFTSFGHVWPNQYFRHLVSKNQQKNKRTKCVVPRN